MSAAVSKVAATRGTPLPGKRGHPVVNVSTSTISHTAQSRDFPFQRLKHFAWAVRFTSAGREQQCDRAFAADPGVAATPTHTIPGWIPFGATRFRPYPRLCLIGSGGVGVTSEASGLW